LHLEQCDTVLCIALTLSPKIQAVLDPSVSDADSVFDTELFLCVWKLRVRTDEYFLEIIQDDQGACDNVKLQPQ